MHNIFVINIGRQLGSGGKSIGEALAQRLNVQVYDKQLINLAAERSGICPKFFERADEKKSLRSRLASLFDYFNEPFTNESLLTEDALFKIQSDVIRDIASRESAIFVGRCADYILRDHPRCVNVFITADLPDRITRLCANFNITPSEAEERIEKSDEERASYYNYYSRGHWGEAATYHLCINSSVLGIEGTTDFIMQFAKL